MAAKELIQTITVGSGGASTIDFTSIPQDATDLIILLSIRSTAASNGRNLQMRFNGNTSDVYSSRYLWGSGSAANSGTDSSGFGFFNWTFANEGTNYTSNTFSNASFYIPNYAGAVAKSVSLDVVNENNATASNQLIQAGLFNSTAAITSISIYDSSSINFAQYTTASLYKFTKGSGGATVS